MGHPVENDLALLAGGETGRVQRFWLERHVRQCEACQTKVSEYAALLTELADCDELPDVNWNFLAAEMRANIRLGLEAGECVRTTQVSKRWNPRFVVAFASLVVLVGSALVGPLLYKPRTVAVQSATPVLESTGAGVEFRTGAASLTLLNRHGGVSNRTVSAQGDIGTRNIDSETGAVTINNVYLQ